MLKSDWLFNHRVVTLVPDKPRRQWLWEVYFGSGDWLHKTTGEASGQIISSTIMFVQCNEMEIEVTKMGQNYLAVIK